MFELISCDVYLTQKAVINFSDITDLPEPTIKSPHKDVPSLFCSNVRVSYIRHTHVHLAVRCSAPLYSY